MAGSGAASLLGIYGDPAALPALQALHGSVKPDAATAGLSSRDEKYVHEAIQKLSAVSGAPDAPRPPRSKPVPRPTAVRPQAQGRNERCACGSGKKYKVCCYQRA